MPQNAISRLESPDYGKPTLTTLKRLAAALDVALVVRFIPFSEMVDWVSGTPRLQDGLSADTLGVPTFGEEEQNGVFDILPDSLHRLGTYRSSEVQSNAECFLTATIGAGVLEMTTVTGSLPKKKPIQPTHMHYEQLNQQGQYASR